MRAFHASDPRRIENARSEPWFDDDDTGGFQVTAEAGQCGADAIERHEIADGTEQAHDDVVMLPEREVGHAALEELAIGVLRPGDREQCRIEVEAVYREAMIAREAARMFTGSAGDIEDRASLRMDRTDEIRDLDRLGGVVLEAVDGVVELGGLGEHRSRRSYAIPER